MKNNVSELSQSIINKNKLNQNQINIQINKNKQNKFKKILTDKCKFLKNFNLKQN